MNCNMCGGKIKIVEDHRRIGHCESTEREETIEEVKKILAGCKTCVYLKEVKQRISALKGGK